MTRRLAELEPFELAGVAPLVEVHEVRLRTERIADPEEAAGTDVLAFVVVVARRAVLRSDHHRRAAQQQLDPRVLSLLRHLHLGAVVVDRVLHDHRDRHARLGQVVGDVRDEVRALRRLDDEHVREAVDVRAVLRPHPVGPVPRQLHAVATGHVEAGAAGELGADLEP